MKEAKPDAWMPLWIGDYKKDTGRLTRDLHGGYLLLIMEYWNTGPLPDDDDELASIVLADAREWKKLRPKLERFFQVADGYWNHKRIDRELLVWGERKEKAAARAKAAADARWAKEQHAPPPNPRRKKDAPSNAPGIAPSTPQAMLDQCPSPSPLEVETPNSVSTLQPGKPSSDRPDGSSSACPTVEPDSPEVAARKALIEAHGVNFASRYFDGSPIEGGIIRPGNDIAAKRLIEAAETLAAHGITIGETIPPRAQAHA